jgi:AsmA protein
MRRALIICASVVAILGAAVAALFLLVDVNQFRAPVQASLQRQLKRPVTLGNMSLGIFPLTIKVDDVTIGENPRFPTGRPFATVKEIRVRAELLPLLRKEVHVDSVSLARPAFEIVRDRTGQYNFSDLTNQPPSGQPSSGNTGGSVSLAQLDVEDGALTTSTLGQPNTRNVYDHIDISVTDLASGSNPHIKASAVLPGAGKNSLTFEGSGNPLAGTLTLTDAPLAGLAKFAGSSIPVDGLVSGSTTLRSAASVTTAQGRLDLKKASANGQDLGAPFTLNYNLSDDSRSDTLRATRLDLRAGKLGGMRGSFVMTGGAADRLTFNFDIDKVDVAELQRISAASTAGPAPAATKSSSPQLSARGSIHIGSLTDQGLVLSNIRANCDFNHGVVTLAPLSAQAFGGTHTGSITVDTRSRTTPATLKLKLDNADANQLLSATTSLKNTLYGRLGASGDIGMNLGDTSTLARSLNGNLSVSLMDGHLANVNVMREISSIGKFLGSAASARNTTNIAKLAGDLKLTNGVADTNNLQLQMEEGSLAAAGTVNLVDQTINMKVTAVVNRTLSQRVGGTGIGGYLQTALANRNGELVVPALVTGTLAHPRFAPDVAAVAQMKLKNAVPTTGGIGSILGALTGRQQQSNPQGQQNQQNQQNRSGPLGILDSLTHRKKQ